MYKQTDLSADGGMCVCVCVCAVCVCVCTDLVLDIMVKRYQAYYVLAHLLPLIILAYSE